MYIYTYIGEYTVMEADAKSSLLSDIGSYSRLQVCIYIHIYSTFLCL
jgi:hypothetical protein